MMIKLKLIVLWMVLATNIMISQTSIIHNFDDYRKWGFGMSLLMYKKAELFPRYGNYTFRNRNIIGGNIGFTYDFFPMKKWSVLSGFYFELEPFYRLDVTIEKEDVPDYKLELINKTSFPYFSFNIPLLFQYQHQLNHNIFGSISMGILGKYYPYGYSDLTIHQPTVTYINYTKLFFLKGESSKNAFQGGLMVSPKLTRLYKRMIINIKFIVFFNFQYSFKGTYEFDNLVKSSPSGGDYLLSGNYFGISFSMNLLQQKEKKYIFHLSYKQDCLNSIRSLYLTKEIDKLK